MSSGGKGLRNWILQRSTAVFLTGYVFFLIYFWLTHTEAAQLDWQSLFSGLLMKVATLIALVALLIHAWLGVWTIITDYVPAFGLRIFLLNGVGFGLLGYLGWGLYILWG